MIFFSFFTHFSFNITPCPFSQLCVAGLHHHLSFHRGFRVSAEGKKNPSVWIGCFQPGLVQFKSISCSQNLMQSLTQANAWQPTKASALGNVFPLSSNYPLCHMPEALERWYWGFKSISGCPSNECLPVTVSSVTVIVNAVMQKFFSKHASNIWSVRSQAVSWFQPRNNVVPAKTNPRKRQWHRKRAARSVSFNSYLDPNLPVQISKALGISLALHSTIPQRMNAWQSLTAANSTQWCSSFPPWLTLFGLATLGIRTVLPKKKKWVDEDNTGMMTVWPQSVKRTLSSGSPLKGPVNLATNQGPLTRHSHSTQLD